jgi:hypothetical protein
MIGFTGRLTVSATTGTTFLRVLRRAFKRNLLRNYQTHLVPDRKWHHWRDIAPEGF